MPNVKIRPNELRDMHAAELRSKLEEQRTVLMRERAQGPSATSDFGNSENPSPGALREVRKNIARIKTVLNRRLKKNEHE